MMLRATALIRMKPTVDADQPGMTNPRAAPAAGGCSEFVYTISKMLAPTATAAATSRTKW